MIIDDNATWHEISYKYDHWFINGYVTGRFCKASVPTEVAFAFAAAKKIKRGRTNVCSLLGSPCENFW